MPPKPPKLTPEQAVRFQNLYRQMPDAYVQDILLSDPWSTQIEIIKSVFNNRYTAVKSCNAIGKSYISARIALAFLELHKDSIVLTTAPTWRQVKDILWRELGSAYAKSLIKFGPADPSQVGLELSKSWYAVGLSTRDSEKFYGYHAPHILVIVDEASGVEEAIYNGVDAVTTDKNAHVLLIGNPTSSDGRFRRAFTDPNIAGLYNKFTISAFDTPNFKANNINNLDDLLDVFTPPAGVELIDHIKKVSANLITAKPGLIDPVVAYTRYLENGTDSPFWQANIMGEFPSQAENSLIPMHLIQKSMDVRKQIDRINTLDTNSPEYKEYLQHPEWNVEISEVTDIGIDVARFGSDKTVMLRRNGGYVNDAVSWAKKDTSETSERVFNTIDPQDHMTTLLIDETGVGGGVVDQLRKMVANNALFRFNVRGINFGAATTQPEKFYNYRAEMFWNLRELFINHKIALPDDPELANELASIRYEYTTKSQLKIEAKDEIKKRTGKSPDKADALALAFAKINRISWGNLPQSPTTPAAQKPIFSQPVNKGAAFRPMTDRNKVF